MRLGLEMGIPSNLIKHHPANTQQRKMTMTTRNQTKIIGCAAIFALMSQAAPGANYIMLNDPSLSTGFEQRWNHPAVWQLDSGVDDGGDGIPNGADTFEINRNTGGFPANNTDLSNEGMPNNHTVAGITGTGAPGRDIVLKTSNTIIGDLTVLTSASVFEILEERDKSLTINGVISGAGDLTLSRNGGFSDGVTPDEVITLTGLSVNTISGSITLRNNSGSEPSYWVADKVGAFGQAPTLTLEGPSGGVASLRITASTIGGEGAIDDNATAFIVGLSGILDVDAGVDEQIGEGNLTVGGSVIAPGSYNNSESWITGPGTITVIPEPGSLALLGLGGLLAARRRRG